MKKLNYFLMMAVLMIAAFSYSSCGDDNNNNGNDGTGGDTNFDPSLIGSWLLVELSGYYIYEGEKHEYHGSAGDGDLDDYTKYVFRKDGTIICYEREIDPNPDKGTWVTKDGTVYFQWEENADGDVEIDIEKYTVVGTTLILEETDYDGYDKEIYKKVK